MPPLPDQPWTTSTPTSQDTPGVEQPNLQNDSSPGAEDGHRVLAQHLHALRDKLQNAYAEIGSNPGDLPAGSLRDRVAVLEASAFIPDTKPVQGTWLTSSTVRFSERPGQPTTVRHTLQDGKQRTWNLATPATWDDANGVADLGWDELASQTGTDKWIYWYLVPNSGDDNLLTIRASDNDPTVGPTGYTNYKLVWEDYEDTGSLREVHQSGRIFRYTEIVEGAASAAIPQTTPQARGALSQVDVVPPTADVMHFEMIISHTSTAGGTVTGILYATSATLRTARIVLVDSFQTDHENGVILLPGRNQSLDFESTGANIDQQSVYALGWESAFVDA